MGHKSFANHVMTNPFGNITLLLLIFMVITFVSGFEVTHSAHEFLVLEMNVVQVEGQVAFGKGLKVAQTTRNHHFASERDRCQICARFTHTKEVSNLCGEN